MRAWVAGWLADPIYLLRGCFCCGCVLQVGHGIGGLCAGVLTQARRRAIGGGDGRLFTVVARALVDRLMVTQLVTLKAELLRPFAALVVGHGGGMAAPDLLRGIQAVPFRPPPPSQRSRRQTRRSQAAAASSSAGANAVPQQTTAVGAVFQAWIEVGCVSQSYACDSPMPGLRANFAFVPGAATQTHECVLGVVREQRLFVRSCTRR